MSSFWKRALSGIVFVGIVISCIFVHPLTFFVLFLIVNVMGLLEFANMTRRMDVHICTPLYLLCGCTLFASGFLHTFLDYREVYFFFFICTFALSIYELFRKQGNAFKNLAFSFYGLLYITLPFTLLAYFPSMIGKESWAPEIVFLPFFLVWFNDTFAYLFGVTLGKHKLFPRISPNKSWEGAIGGGLSTLVAAFFIAPLLDYLSMTDHMIIASIIVVFGIFGDLLESMFKRSVNLKDSGNFMPGHGGILDRFDAVIFSIPAIFVYLEFIYVK